MDSNSTCFYSTCLGLLCVLRTVNTKRHIFTSRKSSQKRQGERHDQRDDINDQSWARRVVVLLNHLLICFLEYARCPTLQSSHAGPPPACTLFNIMSVYHIRLPSQNRTYSSHIRQNCVVNLSRDDRSNVIQGVNPLHNALILVRSGVFAVWLGTCDPQAFDQHECKTSFLHERIAVVRHHNCKTHCPVNYGSSIWRRGRHDICRGYHHYPSWEQLQRYRTQAKAAVAVGCRVILQHQEHLCIGDVLVNPCFAKNAKVKSIFENRMNK